MPNYMNIIIRSIMAYFTLFLLARIMGKREISQMTYFDYIVGITIGSMTAYLALDNSQKFTAILPALLIFAIFQIASAYLSLKSITFRKIADGTSTMLIKHGKVLEKNLLKTRMNIDELNAKLREKNTFNLADVEFAFLEQDGKISVMKKPHKQPMTPSDFRIPVEYTGIGTLVVREGMIQGEQLKKFGLTRSWLMSKLAEQGIYDLSKVMFAQVDAAGKLYIDLYDEYADDLKPDTSNFVLLAKLEKVHADFLSFSIETENTSAKALYDKCAEQMQHITAQYRSYTNKKYPQNMIIHKKIH
ncbi:DUF421 domain-containing protein [Clostridiaceae bacterium 35-E11]